MTTLILDVPSLSTKVPDLIRERFNNEAIIPLYQSTSGFFCIEQQPGDKIPFFEFKLYSGEPYELSFPYRTYMVSGFLNYSQLKREVSRLPPGVILLVDLALRDLDGEFDTSSAYGAISSAIIKIKNSDPEKDKKTLRKNLCQVINELWSITEDRGTLILVAFWDYYPGLTSNFKYEFPRVFIDDITGPLFNKVGYFLPSPIGPPYGNYNSTRYVCEQIEKMIKE